MEKERTSPWLILFRVVFTAALIACIMFIFRNSLENGAQSSARSQAVMQLVNSALAKVHLGPLSEHLIRKLAHFSEFALEGFLLMLCIRVYTKHFVRHMSWPLLGGMTTALMDETIQLHSLNRTSSVVDVWIDMSGVVAGLLFALIILLIVRGVTAFIRVKQENRALRAESAELRRREHEPIETTGQFVEIIKAGIPAAARRHGGHPAKKSFQAIRIEVNHELDVLERGLDAATRWLNPGGRICVISYHSLEDRIVKNHFKEMSQGCTCPPEIPVCVCGNVPILKVITRKPLVAQPDEVERNPRARSAKIRVAQRL